MWTKPVLNRILTVDDDRGFCDLVTSFFANYGIEAIQAPTGKDAVVEMKKYPFPVVILDYRLPLVDGDDLIAILQNLNPKAKFIVVSGLLGEDVEEKFKGTGYMAYFGKGDLQLKDLLNSVQQVLHNS